MKKKMLEPFTERKKKSDSERRQENIAKQKAGLTVEIDQLAKNLAGKLLERSRYKHYEGDLDGAISDLTQSIQLDSRWDAYAWLGECKILQGNYQAALEHYTIAIKLNPSNPLIYRQRAIVHELLSQLSKSRQDHMEAESLEIQVPENKAFNSPEKLKKLASQYYQFALDRRHEEPRNGVVFCSEAIRLDPNEPQYYRSRAQMCRALGEQKKAEKDDNKASLLEANRRPTLPPIELDVKNIRYFPSNITGLIGQFESLSTLNNHALTSKFNQDILTVGFKTRSLNLLENEWNAVIKSEKFKICEFLEELPGILEKDHQARVELLQYVIEQRYFALIGFLIQNKIDINSPWEHVYYTPGEHYNRMTDTFIEKSIKNSSTYHVLDKFFTTKPIDAEVALKLINLKFNISDYNFTRYIIPDSLEVLKTLQSSELQRIAAIKLIMIGSKRNLVQDSDIETVIKLAKNVHDPIVKQAETVFLIKQLESLIPSSLKFWSDRSEVPLIGKWIDQLKALAAVPDDDEYIKGLEKIKSNLYKEAPCTGQLFSCLQSLQAKELVTFPSDFDLKTKGRSEDKKTKAFIEKEPIPVTLDMVKEYLKELLGSNSSIFDLDMKLKSNPINDIDQINTIGGINQWLQDNKWSKDHGYKLKTLIFADISKNSKNTCIAQDVYEFLRIYIPELLGHKKTVPSADTEVTESVPISKGSFG